MPGRLVREALRTNTRLRLASGLGFRVKGLGFGVEGLGLYSQKPKRAVNPKPQTLTRPGTAVDGDWPIRPEDGSSDVLYVARGERFGFRGSWVHALGAEEFPGVRFKGFGVPYAYGSNPKLYTRTLLGGSCVLITPVRTAPISPPSL